MAFDRFHRLPRPRQEQIIHAAAEAFAAHGYEATSFNALLESIGLSKSQAYYYFADKADLFITACAACYEAYFEQVASLPPPASAAQFWEHVLQLLRIGFQFQQQHPLAARLNRAVAQSPLRGELGRSSAHRAVSPRARHEEWLRLGQALGAVRTDLPFELLVSLSLGISTEVDIWFADVSQSYDEPRLEALARELRDVLRAALGRPSKKHKGGG